MEKVEYTINDVALLLKETSERILKYEPDFDNMEFCRLFDLFKNNIKWGLHVIESLNK